MPLPPDSILRAAVRWLERLPASGHKRCRALFSAHPDFSDLTPTQYDAAYGWLKETGLLERAGEPSSIPQRIFEAALPGLPWFQDADILVRDPGELPEDALTAAETLGIDRAQAFRHIRALWGKVDLEQRERIGTAGETALVKLLEGSVDAQVQHVSQTSDGHGYDIEVVGASCRLHIEAKTTLRRQRLTMFLSRHEYETMIHDPAWQLVAVRLSGDMEIEAVCSVPREWIKRNTPCDRAVSGRWESCRLTVPLSEITSGITRLRPLLADTVSPVIDGTTGW
ncbi:protein NO VEIN domain-containing protein [Spongiactinospora sp. 9N601]|uniref:protein NO VEIN domain-containing protein n=1 Tax=Spongiactinospora sp. 9N601 TaxID=3375149 RepID=UPI00378FC2A6